MTVLKYLFLLLSIAGFVAFGLSFENPELAPYRWPLLFAAIVLLTLTPNSRVIRAAFGTLILATLVFFVTQFLSDLPFANKSIDLTEDNRYTLTEGTRAILGDLTEPVTINYYVTRDVDGTPASFKRHIPRVDSFLREIKSLANDGLVTLHFIDPEPNTDEEDAALLDQVQQVDVTQDDKMIFGASISSLEKKTVIPVFDPAQETQLEFQVISAIAEVTTRNTPVIGLMSAHNLAVGGMSNKGWLFNQVLDRTYDPVNLSMMPLATLGDVYEERNWGEHPDYLDPEKIKLILLIHPAGITPEAEFALDQYLLRGGTVIACVDPLSMVAQQSTGPQMPGMPPQQSIPTSSSLPMLFKKHNVAFSTSQVIIDRAYAQQGGSVVILNKEAMPVQDDISLASIQNLALLTAGGFMGAEGAPIGPGLETTRLVESSYKYTFIDNEKVTASDAQQQLRFALGNQTTSDQRQSYVTLLSGTFETAFPEGQPTAPAAGEEPKDDAPLSSGLTTGTARANLYLIADSDFLYDGLSYNYQRLVGNVLPVSGNGPFILNIIDQAVGSPHLIGARARTPVYRTFTVLKDKEAELEKVAGDRIKEFKEKGAQATAKMQQIRSQLTQANSAQLTPEYQAQINEYRKAEVDARKAIRQEQKSHQSQIDALKTDIFMKAILVVPAAVILLGLLVFIWRKIFTHAR